MTAALLLATLRLVAHTLGTSALALVFGGVPAVLAALYLAELAPRAVAVGAQRVLTVSAAVPAVVYGFAVRVALVRGGCGTVLAASLALALMVAPTVALRCLRALRGVSNDLREGAMALGASPWQAAWGAVLPAARGGVAVALAAAFARAAGESIAVSVVLGGSEPRCLGTVGSTLADTLARRGLDTAAAVLVVVLLPLMTAPLWTPPQPRSAAR